MNHIVMYSGGVCSWASAMRVKERHLGENIVLLFADTKMEDEDLYRFLADSEKQLGITIQRISDGRTPWDVFRDERFIGNSRIDPCSRTLKRYLMADWCDSYFKPETTVLHFGLDWTEGHRLERVRKWRTPWRCEAYMTEAPLMSKTQMLTWMQTEGVKPPRLYSMGFHHNNCGGFCIKSGQAQFALLLRKMPERYAFHEQKERNMKEFLGRDDISIMVRMVNGKKEPLSLEQFRKEIESQKEFDQFDFGGCGCGV